MKKRIILLIFIFFAFTGLKSVAFTNELNNGFRDLSWGQDISSVNNLQFYNGSVFFLELEEKINRINQLNNSRILQNKNLHGYRKMNDPLIFKGIRVEDVVYIFEDDIFRGVKLYFLGFDQWHLIKKSFFKDYGENNFIKVEAMYGASGLESYLFFTKGLDSGFRISLNYEKNTESGIILIYYSRSIKEAVQDYKKSNFPKKTHPLKEPGKKTWMQLLEKIKKLNPEGTEAVGGGMNKEGLFVQVRVTEGTEDIIDSKIQEYEARIRQLPEVIDVESKNTSTLNRVEFMMNIKRKDHVIINSRGEKYFEH